MNNTQAIQVKNKTGKLLLYTRRIYHIVTKDTNNAGPASVLFVEPIAYDHVVPARWSVMVRRDALMIELYRAVRVLNEKPRRYTKHDVQNMLHGLEGGGGFNSVIQRITTNLFSICSFCETEYIKTFLVWFLGIDCKIP